MKRKSLKKERRARKTKKKRIFKLKKMRKRCLKEKNLNNLKMLISQMIKKS